MCPAPMFVAGTTRLRARMTRLPEVSGAVRMMLFDASPVLRRQDVWRSEVRQLPRLFAGDARDVAEVVTGRHDLHDCLTLLRGAMTQRPAEDRLRGVWAVGAMTPDLAETLADATDAAAVVTVMARQGLPTPLAAHALRRLWARFELHGDVEELELGLVAAAHADWATRLTHRKSRPAADLLARERDQRNLVTVLARGSVNAERLLTVGALSPRDLEQAVSGRWAPLLRSYPRWRPALEAFTQLQDLTRLDRDLHDRSTADAAAMLRRGDAHSAEPLVGYVLLLEDHARDARRAELLTVVGAEPSISDRSASDRTAFDRSSTDRSAW